MSQAARTALRYIFNAGGNATIDSFMDDHKPVGHLLWYELRNPVVLVQPDPAPGRERFLVLTDAGRAALAEFN